jgi:hypothetical protein
VTLAVATLLSLASTASAAQPYRYDYKYSGGSAGAYGWTYDYDAGEYEYLSLNGYEAVQKSGSDKWEYHYVYGYYYQYTPTGYAWLSAYGSPATFAVNGLGSAEIDGDLAVYGYVCSYYPSYSCQWIDSTASVDLELAGDGEVWSGLSHYRYHGPYYSYSSRQTGQSRDAEIVSGTFSVEDWVAVDLTSFADTGGSIGQTKSGYFEMYH